MTLKAMPPLTRTLAVYLNVAYYCLWSPIKITHQKSSGMVKVAKCSGLHKMLYIFMSTVPQAGLACWVLLGDFSVTEEGVKVSSRIHEAIYTMSACGWFCLDTVLKFELWFAPAKATKMLNKLMEVERQLDVLPSRLGLFKHPTILVSIIYGFTTLTSLIDNIMVLVTSVHEPWSVKILFVYAASPWESQVMEFGDKFLIIISGIFLTLANAWKEHVKTLHNSNEVSNFPQMMLGASLSTAKCFGLTFVASCFTKLPFFANRLKNLFGSSFFRQYVYFHNMLSLVVLLYLSAEANSKLQSTVSPFCALQKSRRLPKHATVNGHHGSVQCESLRRRNLLLLDVISREGLGLRGRCMALNYTFFSSIMATILAYSISIMQFQSNSVEFSAENKTISATLTRELQDESQDIWCVRHCNDFVQRNL